jgi:hypothetical protein
MQVIGQCKDVYKQKMKQLNQSTGGVVVDQKQGFWANLFTKKE